MPTIYTREQWGARPPTSTFSAGDAEGIVIHNMQNSNRTPQTGQAERDIAFSISRSCQDDHMDGNGWSDIGQHFTISRGGVIMEARKGSLAAARNGRVIQGAHACGVSQFNRHWFGIELEGDNRVADRVTEQQWSALIELSVWLSQNAGLNRSLPMTPHYDVHADCTDCPGVFGNRVDDLQRAVDQAMGGSGNEVRELRPAVAPATAAAQVSGEIDEEAAGSRGLCAGGHGSAGRASSRSRIALRAEGRDNGTCSDGWYVTGYFTPVETDFSGSERTIQVQGHGAETFKASFLSKVRIEGWGRTRFGWCVGYYGGQWHRSPEPLDAGGRPLEDGTLARDPDLIPSDTQITLPSLPAPWNAKVFRPSDTGGAIIGQHVDVYCGEGYAAEQMTFQITGHGNRLCYI
ncbi:MAG TPA: N-acetylmuramoyl-L-alanine amidase [Chthoniobacteraceae bacterium]|jgi:hypothetical protein|nr:N-acetylmuramoyl-L-alanine amidase [Chthoniobacteraceae bacterium]